MTVIVRFGILILNIIYCALKLLPQKKKVTVISRQSDSPSLDINMLAEKITALHSDYTVTVLCKKLDGGIGRKLGYCFHILRQMYHIATSKILVLDSYCIAASILHHRKSLLVIQMWHSIGTMKKFGYSILDKPEGSSSKVAHLMKMHAGYDYILAAGDGYKEHLAQGFNYPPKKIVTLPLPRVERLKDSGYKTRIINEITAEYPELSPSGLSPTGRFPKQNIVYVPTFRKANDGDFLKALAELCEAVDYEKYNLIVKAHPLTDLSGFNGGKAVIDNKFSSFDMLFIGDIIISDYSCIMYEAAVLKKPVYLYAYDYDSYMSTRDIYMDYKKEVPGPICDTAGELVKAIENADYDFEKADAFLNKYVYMGSKHETEDIVEFMFGKRK